MFPARFTEVILTSTRSPSIPVTSPNTGVPLRMRCPSSVRQFSASCIFSVAPTMTVCVECTNARMTFLSSCRTRRTLLNPLRGVSSGTVSSGSVFPGFSSSPSVASFSLKAEGAGCSVPESGPLPRVCSLRLISPGCAVSRFPGKRCPRVHPFRNSLHRACGFLSGSPFPFPHSRACP